MHEPAPMRVALTLEQCWHRVPGGTGVAGIGMARALSARPEVEVIGVAARHRKPPPVEWTPPVAVRHLPLPRAALYESWNRLRRPPVERATGRVDVVHATTTAVPPRSAPLVVTVHDLAWRADPGHFTRRGAASFERGLQLALAEADLITCPSQATFDACVEAGFDRARLRKIPLGIDVVAAPEDDVDRVRRRYGLDNDYVLWTGTIEPRKNLVGLVNAFALLGAEVDLVLVGPRGWHEDVDARVAPQRHRTRVLGFVPRGDLPALYAGARAFCFPSLLEGFGFPVLEAMAQGVPVVTSKGTSTEELGRDAAILVDPRDHEEIAQALDAVLADDDLAARLSAAGRARAREYPWEATGRALVTAYEEAVGWRKSG